MVSPLTLYPIRIYNRVYPEYTHHTGSFPGKPIMKPTAMNPTDQDQNPQPERSGGAPKGNTNRMRHGLTAAKLPKGCQYIENRVGQFRKQLEAEIVECHGEITILSAALIQSACRHETRAKLLGRWLREGEDEVRTSTSKQGSNGSGTQLTAEVTRTTLTITERSGLLRDISAASDSRDKCVERLSLKQSSNNDPWALFPALPEPQTAQDATGGVSMPDADTSPAMDTAMSKPKASRDAGDESEAMNMPKNDGWTVAREIAGWLPGQTRQCALKQIDRQYELQTLKDDRSVTKCYN